MPKAKPKPQTSPAQASRVAVSDDFVRSVYESFKLHGADALESVRLSDPARYLSFVSDLVPRMAQLEVSSGDSFTGWTEEQLRAEIIEMTARNPAQVERELEQARALIAAREKAEAEADPVVEIINDDDDTPPMLEDRRAPRRG